MLSYCDRRATQQWANFGPPRSGWRQKPAGSVASLAGAPDTCRAPRLPSGLLAPITVIQNGRKGL